MSYDEDPGRTLTPLADISSAVPSWDAPLWTTRNPSMLHSLNTCMKETYVIKQIARQSLILEGINGSGKGTLAERISAHLTARGQAHKIVRDPGTAPVAVRLRALLKDPALAMDTTTQLLLFATARRTLLQEVVEAYHADPTTLFIFDRWVWSTLAYQCADGASPRVVAMLYCEFSPLPTSLALSVWLQLPVECSAARVAAAQGQDFALDRFEAAGADYLRRVSARYQRLADDGALVAVDATQPPDVVCDVVCGLWEKHFATQ